MVRSQRHYLGGYRVSVSSGSGSASRKSAEVERSPARRRVFFFLKLGVSATLLVYLFSLVDPAALFDNVKDLREEFLVAALCLLLTQSVLSTWKWKTILRADGVVLRFPYLLKTYLISNFVSLFLPTSFGGDVYRVMAVRQAGVDTAKTASSVLFDRLTGLFALLSIAAFGYIVLSGYPYRSLAVLAYLFGLFLFWLGSSGWILDRFAGVTQPIARKILRIFESFRTYGRNRRCLVMALAISLAFQLNIVVINKMYSLSLGLEIPFETLLVIIPLIYLTEAIPFSINGLGFREGAFVFFYQLVGQSAEAGLTVSLIVLMMRYGIGLIGGTLLVSSILRDRRSSGEPDESGNA